MYYINDMISLCCIFFLVVLLLSPDNVDNYMQEENVGDKNDCDKLVFNKDSVAVVNSNNPMWHCKK